MTLQSRILLLFVALLFAIQTTSFLLIRQAIEENARSSIASQLEVGERIFLRSIRAKAARLADATEVLASDFGFKSSLASHDMATIDSALDNQRERARARSAYYFTSNFDMAGSAGKPMPPQAIAALRAKAAYSMNATGNIIVSDGDGLLQFALAPVKSPQHVGWIAFGSPIDAQTLAEIKTTTGFDTSLVLSYDNGSSKIAASSFDEQTEHGDLSTALNASYDAREHMRESGSRSISLGFAIPDVVEIKGSHFGTRALPISRDTGVAGYAILMQSIDKAREPYNHLQLTLIALALGGGATFAFGAYLLARSITRPIVELSKAAESIARGDYNAVLPENSPGEIGGLALSFERMRAGLRERELRINKLAYWDTLTGLPNRQQFLEKAAIMIDRCAKAKPPLPCAIAELDLDRIKNINDTLGQAAGDDYLREVASRLASAPIPQDGLAARLNGDKFAMLLPGFGEEAAKEFAEKIHSYFESPAQIGQARIDISAGIGVCIIPMHADNLENAMSRAEFAMYGAKQSKAKTMVYDSKLDNASEDSLSLLSELREALAHGDLLLHYQAKAKLSDGQIRSAEALARWQHPIRGQMPPSAFIPFAEQSGFISQISRWAVLETCKTIAELQDSRREISISANISTRDLLDQDFLTSVSDSLRSTGAKPHLLCLEVTESALMDHPDRSLQAMAALRELGVELSIDDFGTGYSSLGYLRKMPINELKIDRVFILGLTHGNATDEKIVSSTIELAHGLGLRVVAEGVEDPLSFDKLSLAKCDYAQGFGISKPVSKTDFIHLLDTWTPAKIPTEKAC